MPYAVSQRGIDGVRSEIPLVPAGAGATFSVVVVFGETTQAAWDVANKRYVRAKPKPWGTRRFLSAKRHLTLNQRMRLRCSAACFSGFVVA
jgi:hypothetical protein